MPEATSDQPSPHIRRGKCSLKSKEKPMRPLLVLCVIALISLTGFAGSIPFSGSGGNGNLQTGQPFAYDADGGTFAHDWSIPGVNFGTAIWSGPTVVGFLVIFELPTGVIIDDAQVTIGNGADCLGSSIGGTTFCAGPYSAPWAVTMVGRNDILFFWGPSDERRLVLRRHILYRGNPYGAAFSGEFIPIPESTSGILVSSGIFALIVGLSALGG